MPKYIIERNIPGAGALDRQQLAAITQTSCNVLRGMGPQIQWIESYVTDDKIYCVYIAPDEATIREHARLGQFPADMVQAVRSVIDLPTLEITRKVTPQAAFSWRPRSLPSAPA